MAIRDHVQRVHKLRGRVTTVDPSQRIVEVATADGRAHRVYITDISASGFVWPVEGEDWSICEENGMWVLGNKFLNQDEAAEFEALQPGDVWPPRFTVEGTPVNGYVPTWNASTQSWVAQAGSGGGTSSPATTSALGLLKVSTAPVDPANPIAVGDNDPRNTNARTPLAHTHPQVDITNLVSDLAARELTANKGVANGYAPLDSGLLVPLANLPSASTTGRGLIQLAGDLAGTATSPQIATGAVTDTKVAAANKDGVAATPSMRTLGTGAQQAAAGNDSRLSDSRTPTGAAGGDLSGTYPNPTVKTSVLSSLTWDHAVHVLTTSNINIAAPGATIDGVSMVNGYRVCLINQTTATQNGIWVWNGAATPMTRPGDFATGRSFLPGEVVSVGLGTFVHTQYVQTTTGIVDTNASSWSQTTSALSGAAGGSLAGTYPNPTIAAGAITATEVAAANKDGTAATPSMRTLGVGAQQAMAGNRTLDSIALPAGDVSMNSHRITSVSNPVGPADGANKDYVDNVAIAGITWKNAVRVCAPINIAGTYTNGSSGVGATLSIGGTTLTIDGVSLQNSDRVLLANQTTASQNGIYYVDGLGLAGAAQLVRTLDADSGSDLSGATTIVKEGTSPDTIWTMTTDGSIVVGTTSLTWSNIQSTFGTLAQQPANAWETRSAGTGQNPGANVWALCPVGTVTDQSGDSGAFTLNANGTITVRDAGVYAVSTRVGFGNQNLGSRRLSRLVIGTDANTNVLAGDERPTVNGGFPEGVVSYVGYLAAGSTLSVQGLADTAVAFSCNAFGIARVPGNSAVLMGPQAPAIGARVYKPTATSMASGVSQAVVFTNSRFDTDGMWSSSVNPSRLTCRTAGLYAISGTLLWAASGGGFLRLARILLNGTTFIAEQDTKFQTGATSYANVATEYYLNVGDYIELVGYQDSGVALNTSVPANEFVQELSAVRIPGAQGSALGVTSTLPSNPVDGQECYYLADATNGIVWHLKYRAASTSAYKWEYVGGSHLRSDIDTDESTASTTYAALATAGPSITVPLAGDYEIEFGFNGWNSVASLVNNMSFDVGATAASDNDRLMYQGQVTGVAGSASVSRHRTKTGLAAATALVAKYRVSGSGTANFRNRWMRCYPIRVG